MCRADLCVLQVDVAAHRTTGLLSQSGVRWQRGCAVHARRRSIHQLRVLEAADQHAAHSQQLWRCEGHDPDTRLTAACLVAQLPKETL